MSGGAHKGHYSTLSTARFDEYPDSDCTLRNFSPDSPHKQYKKPLSIAHALYDQLKQLDPALPILPSFIRDEQAFNLLEVAIGVIGKRMKRTDEELRLLRSDYEKLRAKSAEGRNRTFSHTPKAEDRAAAVASGSRLRRRENTSDASFEDSYRCAGRGKTFELELADARARSDLLQQENHRLRIQLELSELKLQELAVVKADFSALMQAHIKLEQGGRTLNEKNAELSAQAESLKSEVAKLKTRLKEAESQASSGQLTERTVSLLATALEREKALLNKERGALLRAKREWIRTRPDPEDRVAMAWEDIRAHWLRLDEITTEVLVMQENVHSQESKLLEEKSCLESTVQFLENIHDDVERDKQVLKEQWSKASHDQQTIEFRVEELAAKETQLRQLEAVLQERMHSLEKLEKALRRREMQVMDCRSDEDCSRSFYGDSELPLSRDWQKALESPVLLSDLTPRDVITPVSTEESPRFLDE